MRFSHKESLMTFSAMILPALLFIAGCQSRAVVPPLPDHIRSEFQKSYSEGYYPNFARLRNETGEIIIQIWVEPTGRIGEPIVVDEKSVQFPRLIDAARGLLSGAKVRVGDKYKKTLTASIVFEISPCGIVQHSPGADYNLNLCVDPSPTPQEMTP
jgi:Gram-negative bacterial TonB protein C-terminal